MKRFIEVALVVVGFILLTVAGLSAVAPKKVVPLSTGTPNFSDTILPASGVLGPSAGRVKAVPVTLGERVVRLYGEVNAYTARQVIHELGQLNRVSSDPITLLINSPGGSVLDGAQIVGAIEGSSAKINTVCIELCASMAALIHQYGAQRQMLAHALLMFHPASGGASDDIDRMVSLLQTIKRYTGKMEANVAKRANITFEEYKSRAATHIWIDGEDAVQSRLADQVVFFTGSSIDKIYVQSEEERIELKKKNNRRQFQVAIKQALQALAIYIGGGQPTLEEQIKGTFNDRRD